MDITFKETEKNISFIVRNFDERYKPIFKDQFYTIENNSVIKTFPKPIDDLEQIKNNYIKYTEEMILQAGYFKEVMWEDALFKFINKVKDQNIDWWLTGSCALRLRGIPIKPHDVDIMLNSKDIDKIKNIFIDNIVWPILSTDGWIVKYFGVLFLHGQIDLAFEPQQSADDPEPSDFGPYAMNNLEKIRWKGNVVRIPPLDLQLNVNKRRGRIDRVKAINSFLINN